MHSISLTLLHYSSFLILPLLFSLLSRYFVLHLSAIYAVSFQPPDFGTFFLVVLLTNFILLFIYYAITKCIYGEKPSFRPILFLILALVCWGIGVFFYTQVRQRVWL